MPNITVGISDAKASADPGAVLVTYALGSCVAVCAYDPAARVGGMLHFQLPASTLDEERARVNPLMFADTGFEALLDLLRGLGARAHGLQVKLAGAASIFDDAGLSEIGRRNHEAISRALRKHGLIAAAEDVGGTAPRNLYLSIADGTVTVRTGQYQRTL